MHGARRVIIFCALTTALPIALLVLPLYLRHRVYADVAYAVTESDILEMSDGVSTIFCSAHTLRMNGTFNAFQMGHRPEITSYRKHIRLKKSMTLPDDTLEYWGFYLLRGATVALSVCSRFPGSSILVVKGERSLRTCGLLDHNKNKAHKATGFYMPQADQQVKITFESNAQVIEYEEPTKTITNITHDAPHPKRSRQKKFKEVNDEELAELAETARSYVHKHINDSRVSNNVNISRRLRHARHRFETKIEHENRQTKQARKNNRDNYRKKNVNESKRRKWENTKNSTKMSHRKHYFRSSKNFLHKSNSLARRKKLISLREQLNYIGQDKGGEETDETVGTNNRKHGRYRRNREPLKPPALLDHGIQHGGNAQRNSSESSVSSFEEGLLNCYEGRVLLTQEFAPSELCTNVSYLVNGKHMQTRHDVAEDGYYYYIFYSDNDIVFNDIHAVFDIYKPTFQYENVTKSCLNKTECSFPLSIMSNDRVIVEVPTRDGIDHELDDISLLVSVCHPRMGMYTIFPIAVLFLILCCAFV